jgi:hypothetical protein
MTMYRAYETNSGLIAVAAVGLSGPLLYLAPPATADGNMYKVKCSVAANTGVVTAASLQSAFFSLNKTTGTKAGGAAVTPSPIGPNNLAANIVASSGTTAITGLTQSTEVWGQDEAYSIGSFAGDDDPNTGTEVFLAPSGTYAWYVNLGAGNGFGTNMFVRIIMWHAE